MDEPYFQDKNRDAHVENRHVAGRRGWSGNWEIRLYTLTCVEIASRRLLHSTGSSAWCCDDLEGGMGGMGWKGGPRGQGYMLIHVADSLCYAAEN